MNPSVPKPVPARISTRKKLLFALVAVILLPALGLFALEALGHAYMWWRYGVPGKSYGLYQYDAELGATHRPNSYNTNAQLNNWGFRNDEDVKEPKPPGSLRVYCSGGSTTFCYNLTNAEAWPSQLQAKLRQQPGHDQDQVLNGGQIAQSVSHEFSLAQRFVPKLKPEVVLIHTGVNEVLNGDYLAASGQSLDHLLAEKRFGLAAANLDQAGFLKRNSVLMRFWDYKIKRWFAGEEGAVPLGPSREPHPYVVKNFEVTLGRYLDFLKAQGCRVILLRFGDSGVPNHSQLPMYRLFREQAVALARGRQVEVCDLATVFEQQPNRAELFIASGVHVTAPGAILMAETIRKSLLNPPNSPSKSP